jgi:N-acetyl-anhydromuramyl-L-alanine amidase AmpD
MAVRTCRVGLHGRNQEKFEEVDFQIVREARIETLKMMSQTQSDVFTRLKNENPGIEFIVRLWDDRIGENTHPTPQQFVERMVPEMKRLRSFATKFEIHNEPNHLKRYEGWGQEDADARDFNQWYQQVFRLLKQQCNWAKLGFPGLAIPHRDLEWIDICRPSVEMSDFLGVHCYWQTNTQEPSNHLVKFWGLRFTYYHEKFPNKIIDLLEVGNSNAQNNLPIDDKEIAKQIVEYFQELFKYHYINSAAPFIMSSQDPSWDSFAWRKVSGEVKPVVAAVRDMPRPTLQAATIVTPMVEPTTDERFFEETQQTVRGPFLHFFNQYGLDICGYPITPQMDEGGILVQYFQRVVMEEFEAGKIRLRLAGTEWLNLRQQVTRLEKIVAQAQASGAISFIPPSAPSITDISDQLTHHPTKHYPSRTTTQLDRIVIHHTALPANVSAARIAKVLVSQRDMAGIAYHYFIAEDGTIYQTQPLTALTQHALQFSNTSIGIGFAGDFTDVIPTSQQVKAGGELCAYLMREYNIERDNIKGLSELVAHASPGKQWLEGKKWKNRLLDQVDEALAAVPEPVAPPSDGQVEALQARIAELEQKLTAAQAAQQQVATLRARIAELEKQLATAGPSAPAEGGVIVPPSVGADRIANYQVQKQDLAGVGFHYYINADGRIQQTQPHQVVAHHAADADPTSIGICLAGNFTDEPPPAPQLSATSQLVAWLLQELNLPIEAIHPHKDYVVTACPGNQWDSGAKWGQQLLGQVQDLITGAAPPPTVTEPLGKPMGHYVLFWQTPEDWAKNDFYGAENYIGRFRVTCGFSVDDAMHAEYVTIVGGPLGVPKEAEDLLKQAGCKVERVAGDTFEETNALLDEMAQKGTRFLES